jgi:hypothetical protein
MPKRLKLEPHQTPSELSKLYRQASDPIERTRYQIIWLLATGRVTEDVAEVTGYCRNSIYRLYHFHKIVLQLVAVIFVN